MSYQTFLHGSYANRWENVWTFKTRRFCVAFDIEPCDDDPADHFEFQEHIDAVRNGDVVWFNARVRVLIDHCVIGEDYLCGCAYENVLHDFVESHWRNDYAHRNTLASKAQKVAFCDYFPSMVAEAIKDARKTAMRLRDVGGLREV